MLYKIRSCDQCDNMCNSRTRLTKPLSSNISTTTTTTINNMFSVRNITVCAVATVLVFCSNIHSLHANRLRLSLIEGGESATPIPSAIPPQQQQQPALPRRRPAPRPSRPGGRRPRPRPGRPLIPESILCKGSDLTVDIKLKDKGYVQHQLNCVLDKGPCDKTGLMIKRLAPDVMRGLCPKPCNVCTERQIKRMMATVSRNYPQEWSEMLRSFRRKS